MLCLQEVTPAWETVLAARYGERYPHRLYRVVDPHGATRGAGGLAVLSRFPLTDFGVEPAPNGWHPAWHLQVDPPSGPIQILNVHLRGPLNGRASAVQSLLAVEEDHLKEMEIFTRLLHDGLPTVVLGDFNEETDGAAVSNLERRGFTNTLPLYHPGQGTWRYRSLSNQFDKAMDHILYGPGLEALNAFVRRRGNSDHLPVVAHFELSSN